MRYKVAVLMLAVLFSSNETFGNTDRFVSMFDGKTLDGWTALPGGKWSVVDGTIVGRKQKDEQRHGILVSNRPYGDFVVRFRFQAMEGNSGFYFRCEKVDHPVGVKGFQAEIEPTGKEVGGLYETLGRAWVVRPERDRVPDWYQAEGWNTMTISAIGGDITVTVNGTTTAELKDDTGARTGLIGFQLHGGQRMKVMFKDIEIKEITTSGE